MNIGFLIEGWDAIQPEKSSTLKIIRECIKREHQVGIISPVNLTVRNNVVHGFFHILKKPAGTKEGLTKFHQKAEFSDQMLPVHGFDCIMIRKDPPIDSIMLNFLDSVKGETLIINDIDGLRKANNKLYTTTFHDPDNSFLPVTHVSKNKEYLKRMVNESEAQKMILKPLNASGGSGVIVIEKSAKANINSLLDFYINGHSSKNYVILQEHVEGAEEGDIRVLMLGGKNIGAYQRVPAEGDIRSNIQAGGSARKIEMTEEQKEICRRIGPKLLADGLYFVGVDLIGNKLIEVNVMNPGGITNINRLEKVKLERQVVDFIEDAVRYREEKLNEQAFLLSRREEFKKTVHSIKNHPGEG